MAELIQYFPLALTSTNILTLILGVIGGLILGATPGLSPTMAVALLVPFTFRRPAWFSLVRSTRRLWPAVLSPPF
jgi:putative tricarboxylic transport membrane protein